MERREAYEETPSSRPDHPHEYENREGKCTQDHGFGKKTGSHTNITMGKKRIIAKSEETAAKTSAESKPEGEVLVSQAPKARKEGRIYIFSSYNNTKMSLTDPAGNVISNVSAGAIGFKGARKSTPFAASKVAEMLSTTCKNKGIDRVEILIKGIGSGRESALRSFATKGMEILSIKDITPVPHNGPRPRKVRRV